MTMVTSAITSQQGYPPTALMEAIAELGREAMAAGVLVEQGGLMPISAGGLFDLRGGVVSFTDGPYAETKEWVGGYAVYELASKAEAIAWSQRFIDLHQRFWPGWEGRIEIRQIM